MDSFIGFAGIGGAIIASMGLAMWMEWYCLRWLMRLMPGQAGIVRAQSADETVGAEVEFSSIEPEQANAELVAASTEAARPTGHEIRPGI
ncbi:MAG: hypothetical protein ACRD5M_11605 [Candidatus Acidiferrales bacterium]